MASEPANEAIYVAGSPEAILGTTASPPSSLAQDELGQAVDVGNRVIALDEQDHAQVPGAILAELARALKVSADELLAS